MSAPPISPIEGQRAWGAPLGTAVVASTPADFQVHEQLGFRATGDGPHLLIHVEKRDLATAEAIRRLARYWGVSPKNIGYAGRKDRQAVTRQWLTLPWPEDASLPPVGAVEEGMHLLAVARHRRKLRVGAHVGNRFRLVLRDLEVSGKALEQRLKCIAFQGVPNYFGPQRFGRDGRNLERAMAWSHGDPRARPRGRSERGMLLSTLRSECFNRVLAARVADRSWNRPAGDDVVILDGRGSVFPATRESPGRLQRRAAGLELHATGPLPGRPGGNMDLPPSLMEHEAQALGAMRDVPAWLAEMKLEASRRSLRLLPSGLCWHQPEPAQLVLEFTLPPGGYATTVLREVVNWSAPE